MSELTFAAGEEITKEGEVATMTPSGSSVTNAKGETFGGQPEDMADPYADE